jgi:hypothetical protein
MLPCTLAEIGILGFCGGGLSSPLKLLRMDFWGVPFGALQLIRAKGEGPRSLHLGPPSSLHLSRQGWSLSPYLSETRTVLLATSAKSILS